MKLNSKLLLVLLISMFIFASSIDSFAAYDFDDGTLQGWTKQLPFNGALFVDNSGGNPGGFMVATDTVGGGGGLFANAPSTVSGDLSGYLGIYWDEYVYNNAGLRVSTSVRLLGTDGTTYRSDNTLGLVNMWNSRYVSFSAADSWTLLSGSSSFETVLSNVDVLFMSMDTSTSASGNRESGIDNISLAVAPEPVSSTLFVIGATTMGFRLYRKKKTES